MLIEPPRINLLPWREYYREAKQKQFVYLFMCCLLLAFVLNFLVYILFQAKINHQEQRNAYIGQYIQQLDQEIADVTKLTKMKEAILKRMAVVQSLQENRFNVVRIFDQMPRLLPKGVYLEEMTYEAGQISLQGKAQSNTDVSYFMRNVEQSSWLTAPMLTEIKNIKKNGVSESEFKLRIQEKFLPVHDENDRVNSQ